MQVMIERHQPFGEQTMTRVEDKAKAIAIKELLERDEDSVRSAVQSLVQAALEAEMTEALSAEKGQRCESRLMRDRIRWNQSAASLSRNPREGGDPVLRRFNGLLDPRLRGDFEEVRTPKLIKL